MSKCFSCLEYLRDEDFAVREEKDGTFLLAAIISFKYNVREKVLAIP